MSMCNGTALSILLSSCSLLARPLQPWVKVSASTSANALIETMAARFHSCLHNLQLLLVGSICTAQQTCHITPVEALQPRS
ncbi:uncharacterized protein BKA78DRAFT_319499, partial [Phyllosticta capitalensis]|uniref:uncharacterized protein n=1 Tax=Phyllosticta capitalensis TaxID=121624 RepID=UPI00312F05C2